VSDDSSRLPEPGSRYDAYVDRVRRSLEHAPGELSSDTRRAILNRDTKAIPPSLLPYVLKVALHAYKVEDEDISGLKRDGMSEDQIFEATAVAAVGAALLRLDKGMAALRGSEAARTT
jgi:hypothetical protein